MSKKDQIPFSRAIKVRGRYVNPYMPSLRRSIGHFFLWQMGYYKDLIKATPPPNDFRYPSPKGFADETKPQVTWIGHSSFLIKAGVNILTDPVFAGCCAPFSLFGPKRKIELPFMIGDLPRIDFVLLSHNHYDHLDEHGIKKISEDNPACIWIVPIGVKKWFTKRKVQKVYEFSWGDASLFEGGVKITSVPCQHFSGRGLFDTNKTLWSGYVVELKNINKKIYFVGDTGYNPFDFKAIGQFWKGFDLSLIPIGSYLPREFMKSVHINPIEAVKIHEEVYSERSIGMHWKSFRLSEEPMERPAYDLYLEMQLKKLDTSSFFVLDPGNSTNF